MLYMRRILLALLLAFTLHLNAQEPNDSVVYRYMIAEAQGVFLGECKVRVDDGRDPETVKRKDRNYYFKSYAGALNYFTSLGWEFVTQVDVTLGRIYFVFRRPTTKEELQPIIDQSIIEK